MFALLHMSAADAAIACWRGKFESGLWHPVTAIPLADTDGNPATIADSAWAPLIGTPPYPDHPSGLSCLTGATSGVLSALFGDIDLTLTSPVTGTTRRYPTADALDEEVIDARVWSGIHFRKADVDGVRLGHEVAEHALRQAFWGDDPEDGR